MRASNSRATAPSGRGKKEQAYRRIEGRVIERFHKYQGILVPNKDITS